jgi:hypothetical protein
MSTTHTATSVLATMDSLLDWEKQKLIQVNQAIAQIEQCPPHKRSLSVLQAAALLVHQNDLSLDVSDSESDEEKLPAKRVKHADLPASAPALEVAPPKVHSPAKKHPHKPRKPRSYLYESILAATKDRKGTVLYLVNWADCPLEEASFEPASCFGQESGQGIAFEVLFLRKLFKKNLYKFLSNDLCKSASGWKRGPAAPQMKNPQNIDALAHFEFSYQDATDVHFKICNPLAWPFWFKGFDWQVRICIPKHRRFRVSVEEAEEKAKDPDF